MKTNPIFHFDNVNSTGIDIVPTNCTVVIKDFDGNGNSKQLLKIALGTLTETSTIEDFLANSIHFKTLGIYEIPEQEVEQPVVNNYTTGTEQTEILVAYEPSKEVEVFKNGILLRDTKYSIGNPYAIEFNPALSLNDWIRIKAYEFKTSPGAYDISTAVYDGQSVYHGSYNCYDFILSSDGLTYVTSDSGTLHAVSLNNPYDISTIEDRINTAPRIEGVLSGFCFSPSGDKLIKVNSDTKTISLYTTEAPFSIFNAILTEEITTTDGYRKVAISPDGRSLFLIKYEGTYYETLYKHTLTTPWDLTTFNETPTQTNVFPDDVADMNFNPSGTKLYILFISGVTRISQYELSTAWDIATGTLETSIDNTDEGETPTAMHMSLDGSILLIHYYSNHRIVKYKLGN